MADEQKPKDPAEGSAKKPAQDDEVAGKVYDGRLMRRLLTYLRPYKVQTTLSALSIIFKAGSDVMGPYLVKVAVDTICRTRPGEALACPAPQPRPMTGITRSVFLPPARSPSTCWSSADLHHAVDWPEDHVRPAQPDLPPPSACRPPSSTITLSANWYARYSDVDALNEMFTSGVLAIFEDVFVLVFISSSC
jgi:ATP-binding cassette subfamily B protein